MAADRTTTLFYELFSGLPRQGPGSAASTRRALGLVPGVEPRTRVLDVGWGACPDDEHLQELDRTRATKHGVYS